MAAAELDWGRSRRHLDSGKGGVLLQVEGEGYKSEGMGGASVKSVRDSNPCHLVSLASMTVEDLDSGCFKPGDILTRPNW